METDFWSFQNSEFAPFMKLVGAIVSILFFSEDNFL